MEDRELAALRAKLSACDARLLGVVRERLALVEELARHKARKGAPLFDRERERSVLERAGAAAEAQGLPGVLGRRLIQLMVEASHEVQERELARLGAARGERQQLLIVGGAGRFGRRLVETFSARGQTVTAIDKGDALDPNLVKAADIVILCVPMEVVNEVAYRIGAHMRPDALLCDINSLKMRVCEAMAASTAGEVVGMHPMCGPSVASFRRQKLAFCAVREGARAKWLERELAAIGFDILRCSPHEHDQIMAAVQVLNHSATVLTGRALSALGIPVEQSLRFTSPVYRIELALIGRLFAQDPGLYAEIALQNPERKRVAQALQTAAGEVVAALNSGDRADYHKLFEQVRGFLGAFVEEAFALSDRVIDTVSTEP